MIIYNLLIIFKCFILKFSYIKPTLVLFVHKLFLACLKPFKLLTNTAQSIRFQKMNIRAIIYTNNYVGPIRKVYFGEYCVYTYILIGRSDFCNLLDCRIFLRVRYDTTINKIHKILPLSKKFAFIIKIFKNILRENNLYI